MCSTTAATYVAILIGDGYISGLKVAVAKIGPPYVGQLIISVTPRGGCLPATYTCGSAGLLPVILLSPLQALAVLNLQAGCVAAPASVARRRLLATSATVMDVTNLQLQMSVPPPAAAPVPTLLLNDAPVAGVVPTPSLTAVPTSPPTAPQIVSATSPSAGSVQVDFAASSSLGNPPVTFYTVKCVSSSVASGSCASTGTGV